MCLIVKINLKIVVHKAVIIFEMGIYTYCSTRGLVWLNVLEMMSWLLHTDQMFLTNAPKCHCP